VINALKWADPYFWDLTPQKRIARMGLNKRSPQGQGLATEQKRGNPLDILFLLF